MSIWNLYDLIAIARQNPDCAEPPIPAVLRGAQHYAARDATARDWLSASGIVGAEPELRERLRRWSGAMPPSVDLAIRAEEGWARRARGSDTPADVLAASNRCREYRPSVHHTDEDRAAHAVDLATVNAYETARSTRDASDG